MTTLVYEYVTDASRLAHIANEAAQAQVVALDLETTPKPEWRHLEWAALSPHTGEIRLCSLNTGRGVYVIDLWQTKTLGPLATLLHNPTQEVGHGHPVIVGQNCLTSETRVWLADGSRVRLDRLVKEKNPGPVLSFNETTGRIEPKAVVGWIKIKGRPIADWLRIEVRGKGCLRLTKDHEILTVRGRVRAEDIQLGDRIYTDRVEFSEQERAIIYGSLMGDGSIVMQRGAKCRTPYFSVSHAKPQWAYVDFKARVLAKIAKSVVTHEPDEQGYGAKSRSQKRQLRTVSDARLLPVWDKCTVDGQRAISAKWLEQLSDAALAIWYCDDGGLRGAGMSICVSSFGDTGGVLLCEYFHKRGWPARINRRADGHIYLVMAGPMGRGEASEVASFWQAIAPYVLPLLAYKLPPKYRALASEMWWDRPNTASSPWADEVVEVRSLSRVPGDTRRYAGVVSKFLTQYCLTVSDNANFIAEGLAVSNCKFDQSYLYVKYGIELWPVFDTFRASSLVYNGKGVGVRGIGHNLYDLYARELNLKPIAEDLGASNWGDPILTRAQLDYAAEDVTFLPRLRVVLRDKMERLGLFRVALIEFGAILPEAVVEINGFPIDIEAWTQLAEVNKRQVLERSRALLKELPNPYGQLLLPGASDWIFDESTLNRWALDVTEDEDGNRLERAYSAEEQKQLRKASKPKGANNKLHFNLDSTDQVLLSLHKLGGSLRSLESTGEMALALFASTNPVIGRLLEYRGFATKMKSFGADYLRHINPATGRIHPNYFPMLVTGRYGCRSPNLSQIPRDKEYRKCFKAPKGKRFVLADFAGIEMRLAAEISGDKTLTRLFREDLDPHRYTASKLLQKPEDQVTKNERQQAKPCIAAGQRVLTNHGLKPIEKVDVSDLVWDGVEWVAHEGVIYKGYQEVITYEGLTATPDHVVWLASGRTVPLREAASSLGRERLAVGGNGEVPVGFPFTDRERRAGGQEAGEVRRVRVLDLQTALFDLPIEHPYGEDHELQVSAGRQVRTGSPRPRLGGSLRRDLTALYRVAERALQELRGPWDRTPFRVPGAFYPLDAEGAAAQDLQERADRSREQRRSLRAWESAVGDAEGKSSQQAHESLGGLLRRARAAGGSPYPYFGGLPRVQVRAVDGREVHELEEDEADAGRTAAAGRGRGARHADSTYAHVYDLVNAGPRHRYVVENTVVLNCNFGFLYGMQAEKFVLYALANYGVTLTLDQSRQFRQRFFDEYTGLQAWHEVTLREGKRRRTSTTPMGRLRYMDEMAHNEYLNHPVQACLCPEVRVLTTQGYEAIGELYTQGCGDRQVWTGVCWADFEVRAMGAHPLAEIELQDGSILRCDTNHQLLVVEESGYVWRSYADLREGDRVATSLVRAVEFSGELLPEMEHGERSTLKPELPAGMDADLWWWLGYYMGNGWLADRGCLSYVMGEHRPDLLKKCVDFWVGWGANPKVTHQTRTMPSGKTGRAVKIDVWSVDIVRWLYKLGFVESTAHTKRIPKLVFTATLQQRQQFVMGLFGADGYNNNPCQGDPNLHMCNRLLLEDTKVILRSLGVESVLRGPYTYKGFTSYRLDIFNRMWRDMLGEGSGHWPKLVGMDVPAFLLRAVKLRYGYEKMRKFPSNSAYVLYRRMLAGGTVGVYTFDRLCAAMGWVFEEPLYGYRCLVAKRELGITGTTYTLSVDDPLHRFDAEGVITKNSGADGLKLSLREIFMRTKKYGGAVKMVHHVHDEIITELPDDEELAKKWSLEMKEGMEGAMSKVLRKVPVLAEPAVGYSWGDKS